MKTINKRILGIATAAFCLTSFTSCLEETFPESGTMTSEQVQASDAAVEGMVLGMPAKFIDVWDTSSHCFFGYPAEMIFRDMLTGDYYHTGETGYSHFISWQRNQYMGDGYLNTQFHWNFYYGFLLPVNGVLAALQDESALSESSKGNKGAAYAFRAMLYLDMARMFEFLPNEIFADGLNNKGKKVTNLTVPIVTEETTDDESRNNPRATREDMAAFIESDLNKAEELIVYLNNTQGNTLPNLAVVYGLKARLYMWVEDYAKAEQYARLAIQNSPVAPITKNAALDKTTGYNLASQFMWAAQQNKESDCVSTGIINWTSWASNQTSFGYTGASTALYVVMDKNMYERIGDTDWRKKQWVAPAGSVLDGENVFLNQTDAESMPEYASLKFRPGSGNTDDYATGASTAVPIMRVEEMYFIEAEAAAHQDVARGIALVEKFMKENRDPNYSCHATEQAAVVDEIVFQKRVELWGEGQTFFDIKRLNMSVTRGYAGTNCQDTQSRINTNGRPAWMNIVMVRTEEQNNEAFVDMNNPDPSDTYKPWTE